MAKSLCKRVDAIVAKAADEAEEAIKAEVRAYFAKKTPVDGFLFGMGTYFFWKEGRSDYFQVRHISDACAAYLDTFGTMTWRIERRGDGVVETTMW